MCQICTVAIIGGLGLSRWLKVDDSVSGVWVGAILVTVIYYTIGFLAKKGIKFWARDFWVSFLYYILTFIPLYTSGIIGHPLNQIWGIDKLVFGTFVGSVVFILSIMLYSWLKKKNNNHAHFPMEKVAIILISLLIVSASLYYLTK